MRYIVMHKVDANMEAGVRPSQELIRDMGALVSESVKSGVFLDGAGLHRSAERVRLTFVGDACTVTRGPLTGENELVAGFAMIKARSMDDAIAHARRLAAATGDREIDVGPVVEPWDLKLAPKPPHIEGGRFLLLRKAGPEFDSGKPPDRKAAAATAKLAAELSQAGVLLKLESLAPTASGARLAAGDKGRRSWTDGPFAESKEMIAGFSILEVASRADAIAWANRYAAILDGNEVDVRLMAEPPIG